MGAVHGRSLTGSCEELELVRGREHHLTGELPGAIAKPHEGTVDGLTTVRVVPISMVDFLKSDDGRLALVQSGAGVDGLQLVVRLDGAVFVGGHGPRHVHVVGMCPGRMRTVAVVAGQ
jgi:hypothetical protein